MKRTAQAAVLRSKEAGFSIESVELDALRADEVLVRNLACGVCHTDAFAPALTPLPAVFGHEGTGIVEAVGSAVAEFREGDHVISSYPHCGSCDGCLEGHPYHCDHHMPLGFSGRRLDGSPTLFSDGSALSGAFFQQSSFATHSIVPARNLIAVEAEVSPLLRAAIPCGVQTGAGTVLNTFRVGAGESVAVFGAGTVGLAAIMAAHLAGARPVIAIDVLPARLELALQLGASHVINAAEGEVDRRIRDILPRGVNYSVETSGNEQALNDAIAGLATGGRCGMVIAPHMGQKYPFATSEIFKRAAMLEGVIQGSAVPRTFLPRLLRLHANGDFPVDRLITSYRFDEIDRAFADAHAGRIVKAVLRFD